MSDVPVNLSVNYLLHAEPRASLRRRSPPPRTAITTSHRPTTPPTMFVLGWMQTTLDRARLVNHRKPKDDQELETFLVGEESRSGIELSVENALGEMNFAPKY